ncbi:FtsB family cell division protein [Persephonella sp.]
MQYLKEKRRSQSLLDRTVKKWFRADIILPIATLLLVIYGGYFLFFGKHNIFKFIEKENYKLSLQHEVSALQKENIYLSEKINYLKKDIFFIEKKAREDLGLVKENEEIYVIIDKEIKNTEKEERWIDKIIRKYQEFKLR